MTILIDLTSVHRRLSGMERFSINISREMILRRPETRFVLLFREEIHPEFAGLCREGRAEAVVLKEGNPLWFYQVRRLWALLRQDADSYLFPAFPAPWLFRNRNTVSVIHDLCDFDCPVGKSKWKALYCRISIRHAIRFSRRLVTVSRFSKQRLVNRLHVAPDRVSVVYNGISPVFSQVLPEPLPDISGKYGIPGNYLLTVSTLEPRKNLRLLIRAFEKLVQCGETELHLVLAGRRGWNLREVLGDASLLGSRIHVTGFVDDSDLPLLYRGAEAFVFPSLYEGFGIPPIEAMSQGTLVVSSDAASLPEILGDAPIYFESNQEEALCDALKKVTAMPEAEKQRRRNLGKQRSELYRWDREAEKLYRAITAEGRGDFPDKEAAYADPVGQ